MREDLEEVFSAPIGTFRVQLFFFTRRRKKRKLHKEKIEVNQHFQGVVVFFLHEGAKRGSCTKKV